MNLITIVITLFLIMDSIGNVSSFLKMTENLTASRRRFVIFREMVFALVVMVLFNYIGEGIFLFLNVSETAVMISAGVILFVTALKIIFPTEDSPRSNLMTGEPFVVPLAIPLIAGPSLLATIMLFAHVEDKQTTMLAAIAIAWVASLAVLLVAPGLKRALGKNGLMAFERLLALVLIMLATQRFMEGIQLFIKTYA